MAVKTLFYLAADSGVPWEVVATCMVGVIALLGGLLAYLAVKVPQHSEWIKGKDKECIAHWKRTEDVDDKLDRIEKTVVRIDQKLIDRNGG